MWRVCLSVSISTSLVLEISNGPSYDRQHNAQGNQEKPTNGASTQSKEGDLCATGEKVGIQTSGSSRTQEKRRRSNIQGTGYHGEEERSALDGSGGKAVDQELLVVSDEREESEFLEGGEELLGLLEGEALLLKLGEDSELGGLLKEAQLADAGEDRVLLSHSKWIAEAIS